MTAADEVPGRPPRRRRSDAQANHERLLHVAEEFFAARGLDASLRVLAEEAHVGIGTLYRNFPSRLDLVRALRDRILADLKAGKTIPGASLLRGLPFLVVNRK